MSLLFILLCCSLASVTIASGDINGIDPFGGASWEFEKIDCKFSWPDPSSYSDVETKPVMFMEVGNATIPSDRAIADYINSFKPAFQAIDVRLKTLFVKTRHGFVEGRLKGVKSLKDNILKYNKSLSSFHDIIGFRVTTRTVKHVLQAKDKVLNDVVNFTVKKPVKCYGVCPGAGKYRPDGYRRVHIIVEVKGKTAEIQLTTPYMTLFADYTHDLVYKGPIQIASNPDVKNYTLQLADYYYNMDQARDELPPCPEVLALANFSEILKMSLGSVEGEKVYKKLGEPPNACQWWNDLVTNHMTEDTCPAPPKPTSSVLRHVGSSYLWITTFIFIVNMNA